MGKYIGEHSALGKGYAKEMTRAWLGFGFNYCDFCAIAAVTRSDNAANIRINEGMGFMVQRSYTEHNIEWLYMVLKKTVWLENLTSVDKHLY